ncbi:MAG: 3-demethylubiquinone-9 3-methyltransferase [Anaerolineales bacterium]|nr:3-demethylubiquinone-9 3-methyltransferase [Anaerolineales bacterium]MBM2844401.1 3-demethylubiquinone-9 3-methyltransferase [Anaerolineales bacterium]
MSPQRIKTYLWFDHEAEEAANLYTSIFKDSKILNVARYGDAGPGPKGTAMTVNFQLEGQEYIALNGGPMYKFTEAISLLVDCETQEEVDRLWNKLTADGGEESMCGWLKDRFGLSWQIIPTALFRLMSDPDPEKSRRVMEAMLQMKKIDVPTLERAHAGQ